MKRAWLVFVVFAASHFLSYFFRSANAVIADDLRSAFHLTPGQLGLMSSLFFAAFALAQLPLGSALDRFGARRTTPALMLAGVAGAAVFAAASGFPLLAAGRTLLGLGTAGILMGALKALSTLYPPRRFAAVSGMLVAVGSSGALVATAPLAVANRAFGWRAVFVVGGAALLLAALAILAWARTPPTPPVEEERPVGFGHIFATPAFWRLAGMGFALMGATFAYQSLWAGPYLLDGAGVPEAAAGNLLLLLGVGLVVGFFAGGWLGQHFGLGRVCALGAAVALAAQVLLALLVSTAPPLLLGVLWFVLAASGSLSLLLYAQAREVFPASVTGRVVTAINLFMFLGGFVVQWGIGVLVGSFAPTADGAPPAAAYRAALLATAGLVALATAAYLPTLRRRA